MKYCVMANLAFDTPAKNDTMSLAIKDQIAGKLIWGAVQHSKSVTEDGKPSNNLEIRFDTEADMNELFALIKNKMLKVPVLKGRLSKHPCPHDENNGSQCEFEEVFVKD